jgi:hypothetical protein
MLYKKVNFTRKLLQVAIILRPPSYFAASPFRRPAQPNLAAAETLPHTKGTWSLSIMQAAHQKHTMITYLMSGLTD